MKKIIITCKHCQKKMKIQNKIAKFKCPSCGAIYKTNYFNLTFINIISFFKAFFETLIEIKNSLIYKINATKSTYKYMNQMRKNMKNNPNWSNYHKEQREMKDANKSSFKNIFKRRK